MGRGLFCIIMRCGPVVAVGVGVGRLSWIHWNAFRLIVRVRLALRFYSAAAMIESTHWHRMNPRNRRP